MKTFVKTCQLDVAYYIQLRFQFLQKNLSLLDLHIAFSYCILFFFVINTMVSLCLKTTSGKKTNKQNVPDPVSLKPLYWALAVYQPMTVPPNSKTTWSLSCRWWYTGETVDETHKQNTGKKSKALSVNKTVAINVSFRPPENLPWSSNSICTRKLKQDPKLTANGTQKNKRRSHPLNVFRGRSFVLFYVVIRI